MNPADLEPLIEAKVKQVLAEMLGLNLPENTGQQWFDPKDAAKHLDLEHRDRLHDLRLSGDLKEGTHWRQSNSKNAKVPRYQYHVGNCRKFLESRRS